MLLSYLDFDKSFNIHTDSSNLQLDVVISQNKKPIAYYSRKLNPTQTHNTMTDKESLAIFVQHPH